MRVGMGYDVHAFTSGDHVKLGGVSITHPRALAGHSDADVLVHAMMDALLGAAGLPDIGVQYPDSDSAYRGISSILLLERTAALIRRHGFDIVNVDSTIIAEEPRVAAHREAMIANVAAALGVHNDQVGIKATTNERLGFVGRGEGIAAMAVALVEKS